MDKPHLKNELLSLPDDQYHQLLKDATQFKCPREESFKQESSKPYNELSAHKNVKDNLSRPNISQEQIHKPVYRDKTDRFEPLERESQKNSKSSESRKFNLKNGPSSNYTGIVNNEQMRNAGIGRGKNRTQPPISDGKNEYVERSRTSVEPSSAGHSGFVDSHRSFKHTANGASVNKQPTVSTLRVGGIVCDNNVKKCAETAQTWLNGNQLLPQHLRSKNVPITEMDNFIAAESGKNHNTEPVNRGWKARPRLTRFPNNGSVPVYNRTLDKRGPDQRFSLPLNHKSFPNIKGQEANFSRHDYRRNQPFNKQSSAGKTHYSKLYGTDKDPSFDVNGNFSAKKINNFHGSNAASKGSDTLTNNYSDKTDVLKTKFVNNIAAACCETTTVCNKNETVSNPSHPCSSTNTYSAKIATTVNTDSKSVYTSAGVPVSRQSATDTFPQKNASHISLSKECVQNLNPVHSTEIDIKNIPNSKSNPLVPNNIELDDINVPNSIGSEYNRQLSTSTDCTDVENFEDCQVSKSELSSFVRDFYSVTDLDHPVEEEFRVVKRQKKRQQKKDGNLPTTNPKLSGSELRNQTEITNKSDKMMLFPALTSGHNGQRVKLDSTCHTSTSSMPPSEQSSADNSDLESVHSLPVGNINYIAPPHSSSAAPINPHASYADVIRMPPAPGNKNVLLQGFNSPDGEGPKAIEHCLHHPDNTSVQEKLVRKDDCGQSAGSSEWIISRLSQLDVNTSNTQSVNGILHHSTQNGQDIVSPRPIVVSLEKPSFYNSSLQINKSAVNTFIHPSNLSSPDRKNIDNNSLIIDCSCNLLSKDKSNEKFTFPPALAQPSVALGDISNHVVDVIANRADGAYSSPSSISSSMSDAFKTANSVSSGQSFDIKVNLPPVIIMDNCMPSGNVSEISFGIEVDEIIKLCNDNTLTDFASYFSPQFSNDSSSEKTVEIIEAKDVSNLEFGGNDPTKPPSDTGFADSSSAKFITIGGKKFLYKDAEAGAAACNMPHIVDFLSDSWSFVEKSLKDDDSNDKIKYYSEE